MMFIITFVVMFNVMIIMMNICNDINDRYNVRCEVYFITYVDVVACVRVFEVFLLDLS